MRCSQAGEVIVRLCVLDVSFLHELRNTILDKTFEDQLNEHVSQLASILHLTKDERRSWFDRRRESIEKHVKKALTPMGSAPPSPPSSPPQSPRVKKQSFFSRLLTRTASGSVGSAKARGRTIRAQGQL